MSFLRRIGQQQHHLRRVASYAQRLPLQHARNVTVRILNDGDACFEHVQSRDPGQPEFLQAVREVIESCEPLFKKYSDYIYVLPVICEPERIIQFRVPWVDDEGHTHVNRGFRVQFSQALGPYKGGLRFHPSVNQSIIKFLGFEQIFKNALTQLPLGGAKGGSDFNPKEKSEAEILRFCQAFMCELCAHIGPDTDVPAGDIGVGGREIGFLYGEWKRITARCQGVLTGKGVGWGGSHIRPEATGYGVVYIMGMAMKDEFNTTYEGKRIALSGSGNVAQYTAEKLMELGGSVVSFSDSGGCIIEPNGFTEKQYKRLFELKAEGKRCRDYAMESKTVQFYENERPWRHVENVDVAMPSATQNEIDGDDAAALLKAGVKFVAEGANMPSTHEAMTLFCKHCDIYIPAKASNAGGVAVSGLEMAQNSQRVIWSREEVDRKLYDIMAQIYDQIKTTAIDLDRPNDYVLGANAAGYKKVADAMFEQGQLLKTWGSFGIAEIQEKVPL
eukprot:CAMPEP_0197048752 /NCGR_PEP_ID=MMETSP1384-20130603/24028_1 /TAXON_ID=29189 /ORGANISM="Ammonia sp." /LENGTH=500 /DNA_ID=CAMNT_0042480931 /DNA_START=182 /DNA_END=1684 /DNA_ORIENTATION=+